MSQENSKLHHMRTDKNYHRGMVEAVNLARVELNMLHHRLREVGDHESAKLVEHTYQNMRECVHRIIENNNPKQ